MEQGSQCLLIPKLLSHLSRHSSSLFIKQLFFLFVVLALFSVTGCYYPVYYVSPYNANATSYHAMPLQSDSVKTATYASANIYVGYANTGQADNVFDFSGNIYQARRFGNFQAYYGGDLSIGNYKARNVGNRTFTGIGASGGIHVLHTFEWGDWRLIGAEFTTHAESGAYARFRKELPADAADVIARSHAFSTAGLSTEMTIKTDPGCVGFRAAGGLTVGNGYGHIHAFNFNTQNYEHLHYGYFTFTFSQNVHRFTVYEQVGFGRYAGGGQFGAVYRMGKKKG